MYALRGYDSRMERETAQDQGSPRGDRARVTNVGVQDEQVALDDVGAQPGEGMAVDDV